MADQESSGTQGISQSITEILQKALEQGIVVNGHLGIDKLTLTSVDTARSLGLVPQGEQQQGQRTGQQSQQGQQGQGGGQSSSQQESVSRQEYDDLRYSVEELRKQLEGMQGQGQGSRRGGSAQR